MDLWGIAGFPSLAGTVTSKTPYSFFFIGCDCRSQLSVDIVEYKSLSTGKRAPRLTEIANEVRLHCIGSPLSIRDVITGANVESKEVAALNEPSVSVDWMEGLDLVESRLRYVAR